MTGTGISSKVDQQIRMLQVLCIAFAVSLLVYSGLAWALVEVVGLEPMVELDPTFKAVIAVAALGMLPAAEVVSRALRGRAIDSPRDLTPDQALQAYSQSTIVGFAMREACGVIGLTLAILTADWLWAVLLSSISLVAMLVAWPRPHAVMDWLLQNPGMRRD